ASALRLGTRSRSAPGPARHLFRRPGRAGALALPLCAALRRGRARPADVRRRDGDARHRRARRQPLARPRCSPARPDGGAAKRVAVAAILARGATNAADVFLGALRRSAPPLVRVGSAPRNAPRRHRLLRTGQARTRKSGGYFRITLSVVNVRKLEYAAAFRQVFKSTTAPPLSLQLLTFPPLIPSLYGPPAPVFGASAST